MKASWLLRFWILKDVLEWGEDDSELIQRGIVPLAKQHVMCGRVDEC